MQYRLSSISLPGSIRQWHWISSAVCLVGMMLFAVTGITLNHAGRIEASPELTTIETVIPDDVLTTARDQFGDGETDIESALPESLRQWLSRELNIRTGSRIAEWSSGEIYLSMPRPGGDAWLSIDLGTADLLYESTDRGWISYLNDLHKGRNAGVVCARFIDVFSIACIVFSVTGLILLIRHSQGRPSTWPLTGLGLLIPVLIALLFIH